MKKWLQGWVAYFAHEVYRVKNNWPNRTFKFKVKAYALLLVACVLASFGLGCLSFTVLSWSVIYVWVGC